MNLKFKTCSLILTILVSRVTLSQTNLSFESGLTNWTTTGGVGKVVIDNANAYDGTKCVKIGPGSGGVWQNFSTSPLSLFWFGAWIKTTSDHDYGHIAVRFFDADSVLLMELIREPVSGTSWKNPGVYYETPAKTKYFQIGIIGDSTNVGYVYGDLFYSVVTWPDPVYTPRCNLDQYMKPFWNTDTIFNETVFMYQASGASVATGTLFYTPMKILSVKKFDLNTSYTEGNDYTIIGKTISKISASTMPYKKQSDLNFNNWNWNNLQSQWVVVTYIPQTNDWKGPIFKYKGDQMPNTMQKLKSHQPLKIVALGMSITRGKDVSNYDKVAPYMPNYINSFAYQLRKKYGYNDIIAINASLPGSSADWAAMYADKYVNPYNPDIVILDFGMNDNGWASPAVFKANIQTAMSKIKAGCPNVEFILLSNLLFDPTYLIDGTLPTIYSRMRGYNTELQSLETTGIIDLDMTTTSDSIYNRKKPKDCLTNPLHPNDYMARWYAQGMFALLDSTNTRTVSESKELSFNDFFKIYPNPSKDGTFTVNISATNTKNGVELSIYDINGNLINRFRQIVDIKEYNASDLKINKGIFIIKMQVNGIYMSKTLIIE